MSLLTLVQKAAVRVGVARPNVVATATDPTVRLLYELAQQEGEELARYGDWRALRKEKTFTTVAAETQTDTPIPTDFAGFIDETCWNRSARRKLYGPIDPQDWQRYKAGNTFPVTDGFTLRGTSWLMQPVPAAGQLIAYEYRSSLWCQSSGGDAQDAWAADSDTGLLSERLMRLGLIWRFKQARGREWQTDHENYLSEVDAELDKDQPRKVIDLKMSGPPKRVPGIVVPEGSWNL
jgi:hypothetical protein